MHILPFVVEFQPMSPVESTCWFKWRTKMRTMTKTGIIAFVASCFAASLLATSPAVTWYVDAKASPGGSGLNPAIAFTTIQAAVDVASSGDTVQIAAGVYRENVIVEGKSLTILGAGREATVIDANGSGRPLYLKGSGISGTRVKSLCLANGRADVGAGLYVDTSDMDVGFLDGKITDCISTGKGAAANGSAWIVRTLVGRCWSTGGEMPVFTGVKGLFSCVVIGCGRRVMGNWNAGGDCSQLIDLYASGEQINVVNCTFSNNAGRLAKYENDTTVGRLVVRNCAFFGVPNNWVRSAMNLQYCFSSRGGVLSNSKNNIGDSTNFPTTHYQIVAPFSDWRPLVGANIIDSGSSALVMSLVPEEYRGKDYYGNTRIQGSAVDIGAAEGGVTPTGGIVFFPIAMPYSARPNPAFHCASNLWVNGYRVVSPDNLATSGNPTWANGIHFASTEANRSAVLRFAYSPDRSNAVWGFRNSSGVATHPNSKGMFTFVLPASPGTVETNSLIYATSVKWVSPDGNDSAAGTEAAPYRTLQKAQDASSSDGVVFAKPGTYEEGSHVGEADGDNVRTTLNRVYISKQLYIVSTDGPETTVIKGNRATGEGTYDGCGTGAMRCVQTKSKACVCGFTLTGGATDASPVAKQLEGKPGNNVNRGNFGGSAAQGYLYANSSADTLQLVDCIVSNNVSYFGTVYCTTAKNCIFTDNRIVDQDSTPGTTVTEACGAMGIVSRFFGCLAYDNDSTKNWLSYSGCYIYDSTIVGEGRINSAAAIVCNTAFVGGVPRDGNGVVSASRSDFADPDNGDWHPVPGSALVSGASSDNLQSVYLKYGTTSLDGLDYTAESGLGLVVGAYRGVSAYPVSAHDWYVNAAKADDSGDGLTPDTAKKTLAAVLALVHRGDVVHAAAGTYDQGEMTNTVKLINSDDTVLIGSRAVLPEGVSLVADEGPDVTFIKGRVGSGGYGLGDDALRGVYMEENTLLEGFTITTCAVKSGGGEHEYNCGACIAAPKANVSRPAVVCNCRLTDGHARSGAAAYGGVLERCRIDDCVLSSDGLTYYAKLRNCLVVSTSTGTLMSALRNYYGVWNSTIYVRSASGDPDFTPAVTGAPIENSIVFYASINRNSTLKNAKNCIICKTKTNLTIDGSCSGLVEATAIQDIVDAATYKPVAGSAAIDAGDMTLFAANPATLDCGGGQRIYSGHVDIGAYEYAPFAEMSAALARHNVTVCEVDGDATLNGGVLLENGILEAIWQKKSEKARREIDFEVTGGGVLVVSDDTGVIGRYAANGAEKLKWSPSGTGAKTIRFAYQPAAGDTSGMGAVVSKIEMANMFMVNFR